MVWSTKNDLQEALTSPREEENNLTRIIETNCCARRIAQRKFDQFEATRLNSNTKLHDKAPHTLPKIGTYVIYAGHITRLGKILPVETIESLWRLNNILEKLPVHDIILLLRQCLVELDFPCLPDCECPQKDVKHELMNELYDAIYFTLSYVVEKRLSDLKKKCQIWNSILLDSINSCFTEIKLMFLGLRCDFIHYRPNDYAESEKITWLTRIGCLMRLISLICGQIFADDKLKVCGKMRFSDDGNYFPKWGNENREISLCNWNISSLIRRFDGISGHMEVWDSRTGNMCVACGWDLTTVENFNIIDCCSHLMCFDCSQQLYHPFLYGR